ncbi:YceH family protein [Neptunomonas japonica]|uniref:YceH family protein n=1 Tax=Neptunomonas japonica TaxID=417574 RepID=UPI00316ACBBA
MDLSLNQTRVIGCLIEKEITTPDQYPLSLNSLTAACNQKSNREPVLALSESDVQEILDELAKKRLIKEEVGFGSRVVKYKHRFCNTEFSELQFSEQALGIICTLFLRGYQTPGELRTRTNRLCKFTDVHEAESVLQYLSEAENGSYVVRLPREPGKRESRYAHQFSGEVDTSGIESSGLSSSANVLHTASRVQDTDKIEVLEQRVTELEQELALLKAQFEEWSS